MKIWYGFASNHSGTYVVLGKFNTIEAAKEAKEKLNKIMKEWMNADVKGTEDTIKITGPDGLLWDVETIDWEDEPEAQQDKKVVSIYLNTSGYGTDDLEKMIRKLGGQSKVKSEDGGDWEEDPTVSTKGKSVRIWLYTAGYGLEDLEKLLKKEGATTAETMSKNDNEE
jgi:hypothetical protein